MLSRAAGTEDLQPASRSAGWQLAPHRPCAPCMYIQQVHVQHMYITYPIDTDSAALRAHNDYDIWNLRRINSLRARTNICGLSLVCGVCGGFGERALRGSSTVRQAAVMASFGLQAGLASHSRAPACMQPLAYAKWRVLLVAMGGIARPTRRCPEVL